MSHALGEYVTDALATFWHLLCSINEHTFSFLCNKTKNKNRKCWCHPCLSSNTCRSEVRTSQSSRIILIYFIFVSNFCYQKNHIGQTPLLSLQLNCSYRLNMLNLVYQVRISPLKHHACCSLTKLLYLWMVSIKQIISNLREKNHSRWNKGGEVQCRGMCASQMCEPTCRLPLH